MSKYSKKHYENVLKNLSKYRMKTIQEMKDEASENKLYLTSQYEENFIEDYMSQFSGKNLSHFIKNELSETDILQTDDFGDPTYYPNWSVSLDMIVLIEGNLLSPISGYPMDVTFESRTIDFLGEKITYQYHHYLCKESGEKFTTTEQDNLNLFNIQEQYSSLIGTL